MAMLSGLIGAEGVRRLNCSCPSKESKSYWSGAPGPSPGGFPGTCPPHRRVVLVETLLGACMEGLATQGPFPGDGERQSRDAAGSAAPSGQPSAAWARGLCRAVAVPATAPGLTHVAIGGFCRAHAVGDALSAAGGAVPCKDSQTGWAQPPADRQGGEGRHAALTERAVTVAVVGPVAQEGVGDAAGMPCKTGGSPSATGSLPWHPRPGAAQPLGTEQRPAPLPWHGGKLAPKDRADAGTYPVAMLRVPGKAWKGRDRPGETPEPQRSPASPRAVKPEPQDVPVPVTLGFVPRELGDSGEPLQNRGLCQGLERVKYPGIPQADPPALLLPPAPHPCPGWASPWPPGAPSSSSACRGKWL